MGDAMGWLDDEGRFGGYRGGESRVCGTGERGLWFMGTHGER
jgi:hypothetical protein